MGLPTGNRIAVHSASILCCALLLGGMVTLPGSNAEPDGFQWIVTTLDSTGDVGSYCALEVTPDGAYHIAYFDATNGHLKFATNASGSPTVETLDSSADTGYYASMDQDANGKMHIAYTTASGDDLYYLTDMGGDWVRQVAIADYRTFAATSIADDGKGDVYIVFHSSVYDDMYYVCNAYGPWQYHDFYRNANVGEYASLAMDVTNKTYTSFYDATNKDLLYNCNFVTGSKEIVDGAGDVGQYTSIALDGSAIPRPFISYYDVSNGDLKLAYREPGYGNGTWNTMVMDSAGDVGRYTSLAVTADGAAHIAYYDISNSALKYASWKDGISSTRTVESAGDVGMYASISLGPDGLPSIAYYDATNGDLKLARMTLAIEEPQYPPGAPTGLSATVESGNNVRVSWTAPILNASQPEVVSYRVLVTSIGLQERDVVVQGTQYLDAGLEHGREYHYEVFARNSAGEGAGQIVSVITSPPESIFVPQAPQLHVSTGAAIELSWEPPERNASTPPITSYRVYRGVSADTLLLLGDVGNVSNFTDPSAQSGVGYWYSISAVNEAGEGAHSAAMPADILSAPKPADQGTVLLVGVIFIPAVAIVIFAIVRRRK